MLIARAIKPPPEGGVNGLPVLLERKASYRRDHFFRPINRRGLAFAHFRSLAVVRQRKRGGMALVKVSPEVELHLKACFDDLCFKTRKRKEKKRKKKGVGVQRGMVEIAVHAGETLAFIGRGL